jgi:epoxyqueuosine reductase QueG
MAAPKIEWAELAAVIAGEGPFIAGAGPVADLRPHFHFGPGVPLDKLTFGISLAYPLSEPVIEECEKGPTVLYKHHYRQVNMLLDRAALTVQGFLQSRGGGALPVPASVFSEWATEKAHLSHKMIAVRAGIGWIGKNILLITPEWGARVRLVSILTDVPLASPPRPNWECGPCKRCASVCPVSAIGNSKDEFNLPACSGQCREFERKGMSVRICGICIRACKPGLGRIVAEAST